MCTTNKIARQTAPPKTELLQKSVPSLSLFLVLSLCVCVPSLVGMLLNNRRPVRGPKVARVARGPEHAVLDLREPRVDNGVREHRRSAPDRLEEPRGARGLPARHQIHRSGKGVPVRVLEVPQRHVVGLRDLKDLHGVAPACGNQK
jgi:hypothetical protein